MTRRFAVLDPFVAELDALELRGRPEAEAVWLVQPVVERWVRDADWLDVSQFAGVAQECALVEHGGPHGVMVLVYGADLRRTNRLLYDPNAGVASPHPNDEFVDDS